MDERTQLVKTFLTNSNSSSFSGLSIADKFSCTCLRFLKPGITHQQICNEADTAEQLLQDLQLKSQIVLLFYLIEFQALQDFHKRILIALFDGLHFQTAEDFLFVFVEKQSFV